MAANEAKMPVKGSEKMVAKGSGKMVAKGSEKMVVNGSEKMVVNGSEKMVVNGSEKMVVNGSEKMVVSGSGKMAAKGSVKIATNITFDTSGRFFSLGTSAKYNFRTDRNTVYRETLGSPKLNIGLAFDGAGWRKVKAHTRVFCTYDDYNWDWTLAFLMHRDSQLEGRAWTVRPSRVLHMNSCGTHAAPADCERVSPAASIQPRLQEIKSLLFPKSLQLKQKIKSKTRNKGNGGWGDRRDIELCLAVANRTATEQTLRNLQLLTSV
ncbi:N-acetylglucosaminyltransferase II [Trinorchestia longiramus]|nr:N-acetylglucosaminyltransferase II [Trinorchestia longiramus]